MVISYYSKKWGILDVVTWVREHEGKVDITELSLPLRSCYLPPAHSPPSPRATYLPRRKFLNDLEKIPRPVPDRIVPSPAPRPEP